MQHDALLTLRSTRRPTRMQNQRHIPLQHLSPPIPLILIRHHAQRLALARLGLINDIQTDTRLPLGCNRDDFDAAFFPGLDRCWFRASGRGDEEDAGLGVF